MICAPCREPHTAEDCIDSAVDPPREGMARWCYCQHAPRRDGQRPRAGGVRGTGPAIRDESPTE